MTKTNKAAELLKVLGQRTPTREVAAPKTQSSLQTGSAAPRRAPQPKASRPRTTAPRGIRGRKIDFYLHAEDEKLIREFAVWLVPHRKRINDSLVVKSVLRAAKTGPGLLAAYDAAASVDGRSRLHKGRHHPA
jgi:hypothetical protein